MKQLLHTSRSAFHNQVKIIKIVEKAEKIAAVLKFWFTLTPNTSRGGNGGGAMENASVE